MAITKISTEKCLFCETPLVEKNFDQHRAHCVNCGAIFNRNHIDLTEAHQPIEWIAVVEDDEEFNKRSIKKVDNVD